MQTSISPKPAHPINFWALSGFVFATNGFLSYDKDLPLLVQIAIFLVGVFLPLSLWVHRTPSFNLQGASIRSSRWDWAFLFSAFAVFQFISIVQWKDWPLPDAGLMAFQADSLSHHWRWDFFLTYAQTPAFSTWALAGWFRFFQPSAFLLRLYPLPFMAGVIALAFFISKRLFPAAAYPLTFLMALSFWPLWIGRFCDYSALLLFTEMVVLALAYKAYEKPTALNFFILSLATGFGLGVGTAWPLVPIGLSLFLYYRFKNSTEDPKKASLYFYLPTALFLVVFGTLWIEQNSGSHFLRLFAFHDNASWAKQLGDSLSYLTGLFWGCDLQGSFGPVWGGLLNPVLTTAFFIGLIVLWRQRQEWPWARLLWIAALGFLLPGLLSKEYNALRITLALPFLLFIVGLGLMTWASSFSQDRRKPFLFALLTLSLVLDVVHLSKSRFDPQGGAHASPETANAVQAYERLQALKAQQGPGCLLLSLLPAFEEQTLALETSSFNDQNNLQTGHWAAWLANINYEPFLRQRFPNLQTQELGPDDVWNQGSLELFWVPLTQVERTHLENWPKAENLFHQLDEEALFDHNRGHTRQLDDAFSAIEPQLGRDPFLESMFYEKRVYLVRFEQDPRLFAGLIDRALERGYPAAHWLVSLGTLDLYLGKLSDAKKLYQKALDSKADQTDAPARLKALERMEPKKVPTRGS